MENSINLRVERSFSDKLNATFTFARQNFKQLAIVLLLLGFPLLVVGNLLMVYMQGIQPDYMGRGMDEVINYITSVGLSMIVLFVAYFWLHLVTISYIAEYAAGNRNITPAAVLKRAYANLGKVLGAGIATGFMLLIAALFLVIPAIYLAIVLSLLVMVIVMEGDPLFEAISRCFYLIKGKWWSTFGLLFVMGIIVGIMQIVFTLPAYIVNFIRVMYHHIVSFDLITILTSIFSTIGVAFVYPLTFIALAFQYFNLVEMKESAGLKMEIEQSANTTTEKQEGEY